MSDHAQPSEVPDTAATLKKMQYQLNAMEKKLDSLLKQSGRGNFNSSYPAKPRRDYDDTKGSFRPKHGKRNDEAASKGKFYSGLQSGGRKGPGKSNFNSKRKSIKRYQEK